MKNRRVTDIDVDNPLLRFGIRLRELRRQRGLSQERLGDLAGLDRTYISSCERGKRNVSLANIHRSARALDVLPSELLSEESCK